VSVVGEAFNELGDSKIKTTCVSELVKRCIKEDYAGI